MLLVIPDLVNEYSTVTHNESEATIKGVEVE